MMVDSIVTTPSGTVTRLWCARCGQRSIVPPAALLPPPAPDTWVGELVVSPALKMVHRDGAELGLTPIEFEILELLALHRGRVVRYAEILERVWGPGWASDNPSDTHVLRSHLARLRRKLGPSRLLGPGGYVRTREGVGLYVPGEPAA